MEIRGSNTSKRGLISIAMSGTSRRYGEVNLIDAFPLTEELWEATKSRHQVNMSWKKLLERYKTPYAWEFSDIVEYEDPVGYNHPRGAVIWVKDN